MAPATARPGNTHTDQMCASNIFHGFVFIKASAKCKWEYFEWLVNHGIVILGPQANLLLGEPSLQSPFLVSVDYPISLSLDQIWLSAFLKQHTSLRLEGF